MKARWLFDLAVTSLGLFVFAACATGSSSQIGSGGDAGEGGEWNGGNSSSSSSGNGGAGGAGGSGSSSGGAGGGASSSSSSSSSGGPCPTPCGLVAPQCGCAAGEACTLDDMGAVACGAAGTVQLGNECISAGDCAAGGLCLAVGSTGACYEFCSSDTQCTAPGGLCVVTLTNGGNPIPNVTMCSMNCNPSTNVGCSNITDAACRFGREQTGQQRLFTLCGTAGTGTSGSSCASNDDCAGGYGCFGTTCEKFCVIGGPACPNFGTCSPFTLGADMIEPTLGGTTYGVCL
jgi:hypothetical protein